MLVKYKASDPKNTRQNAAYLSHCACKIYANLLMNTGHWEHGLWTVGTGHLCTVDTFYDANKTRS